jgi:hypothetical protein
MAKINSLDRHQADSKRNKCGASLEAKTEECIYSIYRVLSICIAIALCSQAMPATASQLYEMPAFQSLSTVPRLHLKVQAGPYWPSLQSNADSQTNLQQYFNTHFAEDRASSLFSVDGPLLKTFSLAYYLPSHFLHHLGGRLALEASVGHWNVSGKARICYSDTDKTTVADTCTTELAANGSSSSTGNTTTSLRVMPLSLALVYTADQALKLFNIPLMPYVKAGLSYQLWWSMVGGDVATTTPTGDDEAVRGEGGTLGYHLAAGLSFNLDWLRSLQPHDASQTMLGSHLFFEASMMQIDQFGTSYTASENSYGKLHLSDVVYSMGITIDFN